MAVLSLLAACRPATISGRVVAIVINALKRMQWSGTAPHISKEVLEELPALADLDPPPTVAGISRGVWVETALSHRTPRAILQGYRSTEMGFAVALHPGATVPTSPRLASTEIESLWAGQTPAIALAKPNPLVASVARVTKNKELPETFPEQIMPLHGRMIALSSAIV